MSLNARTLPVAQSNNFKRPDPLEAGTYPARLVQVVLMGVQKERPYMGEEKAPRLRIRLTYEFLDEFLKDEDGNDLEDKPRWLSEELPFLSLKADLAKSTKRYYALDPESRSEGDWLQLLGAPCMVTVVTEASKKPGSDVVYNNVASVSSMRPKEAAKAPDLKNPSVAFDFYAPTKEAWEVLPEWLQEKIKEAVDFVGSPLEAFLNGKASGGAKKPKAPVEAPVGSPMDHERSKHLEDDEIPW